MIQRIKEIDAAVGITICLVVFGHMKFLADGGIIWYSLMRSFIYKFHMNTFFFIVGFLFFLSTDIDDPKFNYSTFIKKKIKKFLPCYLFFSFIFFLGEYIFSPNRNAFIESLPHELYLLFFIPVKSYPTYLWFLYVLLLIYFFIPLSLKVINKDKRKIIAFSSFGLIFFNFSDFLSLNLFAKYLPWFFLGMLYFDNIAKINIHIKKNGIYYYFLLIVFFIIESFFIHLPPILISFIAIPVILRTSFFNNKLITSLEKIGRNTFPIYLQNMIIVGILYLTSTYILKLSIEKMQFLVPIFFFSSIFIPFLVKGIIQSWHPSIKRLFGYMV